MALRALLILAGAAAFQWSAAPLYRVGEVTPDFVLAAASYVAIEPIRGRLTMLAALGFALDFASLDPLGTQASALLPCALLLRRLLSWRPHQHAAARALLAAPAMWAGIEAQRLYLGLVQDAPPHGFGAGAAAAAYLAALVLVLYPVLDALGPTLDRRGRAWR